MSNETITIKLEGDTIDLSNITNVDLNTGCGGGNSSLIDNGLFNDVITLNLSSDVPTITFTPEPEDKVNHPSHYSKDRLYEPVDIIEDWDLDFNIGNALKYIARAGRKDPAKTIEDLEKAVWYINRHKYFGKSSIVTFVRYNLRKFFKETFTVEDVLEDWDLSPALKIVIKKIYSSRLLRKKDRDFYLDVAIAFVESEIYNIEHNG